MAKALNPFEPSWYVPESDRGLEQPTRFRLRGLDGEKIGYVAPEFIIQDGAVRNLTGRGVELALNYGLIDWENFTNDQGPVRFNRRNFTLIPHELRVELAGEILALSAPDDEEKKT